VSDVFLSYAREDRERARLIAEAIESQGWSVWWDRKIVAGQAFDRTIEEQLESAQAVVVLWSAQSVESEWVRNEAGMASERELLVPVLIEDVKQPLEFRRRHAANLTAWSGDQADPEFMALCDGLAAKSQRQTPRRHHNPPAGAGSTMAHDRPVAPSRGPAGRPASPAWWRTPYAIGAAVAIVALAVWFAGPALVGGDDDQSVGQASRQQRSSDRSGAGTASTPAATGDAQPTDATLNSRTIDSSSGSGRHIDDPAPLQLDTITKIRLEPGEEFYLRLAAPMRGVELVMDMQLVENVSSNLQATLSVLDENGGMLEEDVIRFNEIDRLARETASYDGSPQVRLGFKLRNGGRRADHWLTVRRPGSTGLVPFAGEIVPAPFKLRDTFTGRLEPNERLFYRASLLRGDYQVVLDFARQPRSHGNIRGALVRREATGGNPTVVLGFNEIEMSYRKIGTFTVNRDGPVILQLQSADTLAYSLRVQPAVAEP
jgi:hypothetical protein